MVGSVLGIVGAAVGVVGEFRIEHPRYKRGAKAERDLDDRIMVLLK